MYGLRKKIVSLIYVSAISGPRIPRNFVPDSPESASTSQSSKELFPEDKSSVSDSSEGDSTLEYASNVTTKRKKFVFKNFNKKVKKQESPSSSPIHWPEEIIISSDEELEKSMVEMEKKISLEMSSDSE